MTKLTDEEAYQDAKRLHKIGFYSEPEPENLSAGQKYCVELGRIARLVRESKRHPWESAWVAPK